jgi:hypothetical protein
MRSFIKLAPGVNNKDGVTDDAKRTNGGVGVGLNVVVEKC